MTHTTEPPAFPGRFTSQRPEEKRDKGANNDFKMPPAVEKAGGCICLD